MTVFASVTFLSHYDSFDHGGLFLVPPSSDLEVTSSHVLYGHTARVWRVVWLPHLLLTVGEDAVCRVWDHNGNQLDVVHGHRVGGVA